MAEAQLECHPDIPWTVRLFERVPLAPVWTGLLIAVGVTLVFGVYAYGVGWIDGVRLMGKPFWESSQFWLELLQAVMIGYAPTATVF
jgi:hypothetical protein